MLQVDLIATGKYVYSLSPGTKNGTDAEVGIISLSGDSLRSIVQSFNLGEWAGGSAQGLASYP